MNGIIAVHCGAGQHNASNHSMYNKLCRQACKRAVVVLKGGGNALEAVKAAIKVLENNPLTNAGYGSNLNMEGQVEMDACIMDGKDMISGACGAVKCVKNPIELAYNLCVKQIEPLDMGLVPPIFLVGKGALRHAKSARLCVVSKSKLVSCKALRQYQKYKKMLDSISDCPGDTVGAVCVDLNGCVASGCSSGGVILKRPGRVGQGAICGSGVWAECTEQDMSIAVCTTGCGEYLIHTQLAKQITDDMKVATTCPPVTLSGTIREKFINATSLRRINQKLAGALVIHMDKTKGETAVLWSHTSETMSVGYMNIPKNESKAFISSLPDTSTVGTSIMVGGVYYYEPKTDEVNDSVSIGS